MPSLTGLKGKGPLIVCVLCYLLIKTERYTYISDVGEDDSFHTEICINIFLAISFQYVYLFVQAEA